MEINHERLVQVLCVAEALGMLQDPVQRPRRQHWVHPMNHDRETSGRFFKFYNDIRLYPEKFFLYYRMSIKPFDELLKKVRDHISKRYTPWLNPLSAEERLTITLRYLSTGMTFTALHFEFKIGKSTVGEIVRETCIAIWNMLQKEEMPEPTTEHWLEISNTFYSKTNFPNCLGAVDGKHIRIQNPKNMDSLFFNYKKYFSIILMAVVDANLSFIYIDVGTSPSTVNRNMLRSIFRPRRFPRLNRISVNAYQAVAFKIKQFEFVGWFNRCGSTAMCGLTLSEKGGLN
ncbi:uncharacterized protein LOC132944347 [Metopolophium dirhodum]|uniref:uncharacterized protein LOC132944347 n=1 Tax=Metopolophium dirhodum TaxID=44670 RepID=UPI0029907F31|nr:uncharacterized protein LOC132944347 [Metopolophium dirhodum]